MHLFYISAKEVSSSYSGNNVISFVHCCDQKAWAAGAQTSHCGRK